MKTKRNFLAELDRLSLAGVIEPLIIDADVEELDPDVLKYRIEQIKERVWQTILARCRGRRAQ